MLIAHTGRRAVLSAAAAAVIVVVVIGNYQLTKIAFAFQQRVVKLDIMPPKSVESVAAPRPSVCAGVNLKPLSFFHVNLAFCL